MIALECEHRQTNGQIIHCQLVDIGVPSRNDPCQACRKEWTNGTPSAESLTPTLQAMVARFSGKPIVRESVKIPPLIKRLKTFAVAFARHISNGGKTLSQTDAEARRSICSTCRHKGTYFLADVCNICGCALAIKSKWPEQSCPLRLWSGDSDKPPCGKPCGQSSNRDGDGGTTSRATQ